MVLAVANVPRNPFFHNPEEDKHLTCPRDCSRNRRHVLVLVQVLRLVHVVQVLIQFVELVTCTIDCSRTRWHGRVLVHVLRLFHGVQVLVQLLKIVTCTRCCSRTCRYVLVLVQVMRLVYVVQVLVQLIKIGHVVQDVDPRLPEKEVYKQFSSTNHLWNPPHDMIFGLLTV